MEAKVKALLIDAQARVIREIEVSRENVLQDACDLLGEGTFSLDAALLGRPDSIYVDGNCEAKDKQGFFRIEGQPFTCYGNGIVIAEQQGEYIDVSSTPEAMAQRITWVERPSSPMRTETHMTEGGTQIIIVGDDEFIAAQKETRP